MKNILFTLVALLTTTFWNISQAQTEYGLQIAGIQVTSDNAANITGTSIEGSVSYDNTTKTLTLNKAIISAPNSETCIKNTSIDGLNINLIGKNVLKANKVGGKGVVVQANTNIKGNGSLNIICSDDAGIIINKVTLTISDCIVDAVGTWGITGFDGTNNETLILNNATVSATGASFGSITALATLTMNNCYIKAPANALFNKTRHRVETEGEVVKEEISIVPGKGALYYGIRVADVYVNSENAANIKSDAITGKVSYDDATKTLILDNATITAASTRGIFNEGIQDLTIKLIGTNKITASSVNSTGISAYMSLLITGTGSLSVYSEKHSGIYINSTVTIKDCNVDITGRWGISGYDGLEGETLIINNSTVKAKGERGSICDLMKFSLIASEITKPQGAVWSDDKKCLVLNGSKITDEVIITPKSTGISTSVTDSGIHLWSNNGTLYISTDNTDSASEAQIFNIDGQTVGTVAIYNNKTAINLPAGIYVVRIGNTTEKVIVR